MDSIDTFIQEMMDGLDSEKYIQEILQEKKEPSMPDLKKVMQGFDCVTKLHGIKFYRDDQKALIEYIVVPAVYEGVTISYQRLEILLEGILCCRRKKKW